jgi:hypothetical protein
MLAEDNIYPLGGITREFVFALVEGKEYVVYGLLVRQGFVWYYIADEHFSYYPVWNPAELFEVTDARLSSTWVFGFYNDGPQYPIFSFKEWALDQYYYDRLTDGDEEAVKIFRRQKGIMDNEFRDE